MTLLGNIIVSAVLQFATHGITGLLSVASLLGVLVPLARADPLIFAASAVIVVVITVLSFLVDQWLGSFRRQSAQQRRVVLDREAMIHADVGVTLNIELIVGERERAASLLREFADLALRQGDLTEARRQYEAAIAAFQELGDRHGVASVQAGLANLATNQGDFAEARRQYEAALVTFQALGDRQGENMVLSHLGEVAQASGRLDEAQAYFEQSLAICHEVGDRQGEGMNLERLGVVAVQRGRLDAARAYFEQALAVEREIGSRRGEGVVLANLGEVTGARGQLGEARGYYERSLAIAREIGDASLEAAALVSLAQLSVSQGAVSDAVAQYQSALSAFRQIGDTNNEQVVLHDLADIAEARGDSTSAEALRQQARALPGSPDDRTGEHGTTPPTQPPADRSSTEDQDRVHFSAFYPEIVPVEVPQTMNLYVYMPQVAQRVRTEARAIQKALGVPEPHEVSAPATTAISRGAELRVVPSCDGIEFNPPYIPLRWKGTQNRADFQFEAARHLAGRAVNGEVCIYLEGLEVARLTFAIICRGKDSLVAVAAQQSGIRESKAALHDRIFASYSHDDTGIVELCRRAYEALGIQVLIDRETLLAGELWAKSIPPLIEKAEVFQLFWSPNSARSPYVRQEWEYAMTLDKGEFFIRPVYWEKPLAPVPPALSQFNFKYVPLPVKATPEVGASSVPPMAPERVIVRTAGHTSEPTSGASMTAANPDDFAPSPPSPSEQTNGRTRDLHVGQKAATRWRWRWIPFRRRKRVTVPYAK